MSDGIEVRVAGSGVVRGDEIAPDASTEARCGVCGQERGAVVSVSGGVYACPDCLRARLDALSVARWRLREATPGASGLPWGKISG